MSQNVTSLTRNSEMQWFSRFSKSFKTLQNLDSFKLISILTISVECNNNRIFFSFVKYKQILLILINKTIMINNQRVGNWISK